MGRKTYESIFKKLGKPLPERRNIVITRQEYDVPEGVIIAKSLEEGLVRAGEFGDRVFIIGGQSIYEQTISMGIADKLEITEIQKDFEGDAFFPEINKVIWEEKNKEDGEESGLKYSFVTYKRKRGLFIAFEGIDGSGKTTQMKKFVEYLFSKNKHNHIVLTREPYQETNIRKVLFEGGNPETQAEKLAELFVQDRKKHVNDLILPSLEKGMHVICDRYKLSTIAYQAAQGLDFQKLKEMHKSLVIPDITFVIDLSASEAGERMKGEEGRKAHKFEANLEFLEKVRENFKNSKELLKEEKILIIDGNRGADEIFIEIKDIFEREF